MFEACLDKLSGQNHPPSTQSSKNVLFVSVPTTFIVLKAVVDVYTSMLWEVRTPYILNYKGQTHLSARAGHVAYIRPTLGHYSLGVYAGKYLHSGQQQMGLRAVGRSAVVRAAYLKHS